MKRSRTDGDELIGRIYESIGDPPALADTIQKMVAYNESAAAQFGFVDLSGRWVQASVVGVDPVGLELYIRHHVADDPRTLFCLQHPGGFFADTQMVEDAAEYERSALVSLLDRFGCRYMIGTYFKVSETYLGALCYMRPRRREHYQAGQLRAAASLLPHLQRAMGLHARMGRLESRATSIESLVNRLGSPVLLVDRDGLLRHANAAGLEALRRSSHLVLRSGRVEPSGLWQKSEFRALLAGLSAEPSIEGGPPRNCMRLPDSQGGFAVLAAYALRGIPTLTAQPPALAALFLSYPGTEASIDAASLQILFGLTDAESRLASHLRGGGSLAEFCRASGLSRETGKSQLHALFDKTGAHRQADLVALLSASLSSLLASRA